MKEIATWRERAGLPENYPLHMATHVELAMQGEIQDLRAAISPAPGCHAPAELCISVSNNDEGVYVNIMQRHQDGSSTVLHSAKCPRGDSFGLFTTSAVSPSDATGKAETCVECSDTACGGCISGEGPCMHDASNPYAAPSWCPDDGPGDDEPKQDAGSQVYPDSSLPSMTMDQHMDAEQQDFAQVAALGQAQLMAATDPQQRMADIMQRMGEPAPDGYVDQDAGSDAQRAPVSAPEPVGQQGGKAVAADAGGLPPLPARPKSMMGQTLGYSESDMREYAQLAIEFAARCKTCDGTGDVHRADGEWLGECTACDANRTPAADAGGLSATGHWYAQEFLNWNRSQKNPPVAIGKELGVARKVMEFAEQHRAPAVGAAGQGGAA
jgi:hypothetical protein